MNIHLRIKEIVEKKNIDRESMAKHLNVSTKTIHNYLNGHTKISVEQIPIIAKSLRVRIDDLFQEIGTPTNRPNGENDKENEIEDGCPTCRAKDIEISKLKSELIESQKETISALKGDVKKETPPTSSKKAG